MVTQANAAAAAAAVFPSGAERRPQHVTEFGVCAEPREVAVSGGYIGRSGI
jgi:hypothetical protein